MEIPIFQRQRLIQSKYFRSSELQNLPFQILLQMAYPRSIQFQDTNLNKMSRLDLTIEAT